MYEFRSSVSGFVQIFCFLKCLHHMFLLLFKSSAFGIVLILCLWHCFDLFWHCFDVAFADRCV